jgi:hypothetical protein
MMTCNEKKKKKKNKFYLILIKKKKKKKNQFFLTLSIISIAELDDDVSSLRSQKYLKELEKISHSELKVQAAALRARQLKAAK